MTPGGLLESFLKHSINGRMYCNIGGMVMRQGQRSVGGGQGQVCRRASGCLGEELHEQAACRMRRQPERRWHDISHTRRACVLWLCAACGGTWPASAARPTCTTCTSMGTPG